MKKILVLLLSVFSFTFYSQSIANYSSVRNSAVTYTSISLTGSSFGSWRNAATFTQDDNRSNFTNIGFDFWYNGTRYTQFCVSTNGFLDFSNSTDDGGPQADDFGFNNIAFSAANAADATRPAIAPFYDDLTAQGGTGALGTSLKHAVSGVAPNRTLTVEWINMAVYNNVTPSLNFQVKLVESTGQIIVHYGVMNSGNYTFSYSMGLNSANVSATPTSAQLKALQTFNSNSFSNIVQNNLSAMPAASSQYIFTPVVPTAVSGNLTFSGLSQTAVTLNWPNWANNELGYVVYNSTDGLNYDFVAQTAANVTNYTASALLPATTYFWRLYAVTEGALSSPLTGSLTTNSAGSKISTGNGNWNNAATWSPSGVPTAADNVTIANGHVVSINTNGQCNNLTVGQGSATTLQFSTNTNRTLVVNNNITINTGAVFTTLSNSTATHTVSLQGNIVNSGTLNFAVDGNSLVNVIFNKDGNQTVSGGGAVTTFNRINVNLGTSIKNTLEINASNFLAASNFLEIVSGTLKLSNVNQATLTPYSSSVTLPSNTGLFLNSPNLTLNAEAGVLLFGELNVANGVLNIGNSANEDLASNGGTITISGGTLNIAGKLDAAGINNICDFNISSGLCVVPTFGSTSANVAPFHISSPGSRFNMTGGSIIIQSEGGTGAQDLGFTNNGASATVTGGVLQIGNASTPASQIIDVNTDSRVQNLLINSANVTARLSSNSLSVANDITIANGTLNANNLNISLGGNWLNNTSFIPGTGSVIFSGNSAQSIVKSGGETFGSLIFTGSGLKTFGAPITCNGSFSIAAGAAVDVSAANFSLNIKQNFTNNGTLNTRSALIAFTGTSAQLIDGSTTTNFYDLTLNNNSGATLNSPQNLKGTLSLNNGTFNTNAQAFTMISDANGTARVAEIFGTGDIVGNVTVQRFAPAGATGWAFLGTPISSALTLNDWDDDIAISCATCPDGSAGGFLSVYTYNESALGIYDNAPSYVPLSTINDPIVPGKGYWVYLGNGQFTTSNITLDVTGSLRKNNYAIPLMYTNSGSSADDGWNLIANPYPSAISWTSLRGSTANLDNAIYVYNADLNAGTGGFASFVNGVSSPAVAAGGIGDVIPMSQGFYVHSTGATAINAQESNKVAGNPLFLKSSSSALTQSLLRLFLKGANNYLDETVLYIDANASQTFDKGFDSYKMRGQDPLAPSIALEHANDVFQINGVAPFSGTFSMDVKTLTGYNGTYTLSSENISSFPKGTCLNIYDKFNNTTTDLSTQDYVFTLSDTTSVARFVLNITLNSLTIDAKVTQPGCLTPNQGKIIASGQNGGPWNYYWTLNGNPLKTSLNKNSPDTIDNLLSGIVDLEINSVGLCDNNQSTFLLKEQLPVSAAFVCVDTVYMDVNPIINFTNTSINSTSDYWDFGFGQGNSILPSPAYTYTSPGNYLVKLVTKSNTGCLDSTSKVLNVISNPVSLTNIEDSESELVLKNFQNNTYQILKTFETPKTINIKLFDIGGREVKELNAHANNQLVLDLDLSDMPKGIYFLTLNASQFMKVLKLSVN